MSTPRNVTVYSVDAPREAPVEMCEHKGTGHPDTVTDAVCEAVALALVRVYRSRYGRPAHFNVDKGLLVGGRSVPRFGGGEVLKRPQLIVCGRASDAGGPQPLEQLVTGATAAWLEENLDAGATLFDVSSAVREGSASLVSLFAGDRPRANDTSFGVGYAPLSALEARVASLAAFLAGKRLREEFRAVGQDFKVMGLRQGRRFSFTVAVAMIDRHVGGVRQYFEIKEALRRRLAGDMEAGDELFINRLDDPNARDESGLYLTVTGLSAEMGDDGQVGRGNRVNGLISPGRAMSLEAAAGKNPHSHVGKIYNVLAHQLAHRIAKKVPEAGNVTVRLLSAIGEPLDRPQAASVEISGRATEAVRQQVHALVEHEFDHLESLLSTLAEGRHRVY